MRPIRHVLAAAAVVAALAACSADPTPTPTLAPSTLASAAPSPTETASPSPTVEATPTSTPEPSLALALPDDQDPRVAAVTVTPNVGAEGGEIVVSVTSQADTRVDDLVVRWPTELGETLFLAPFVPSEDRIREGGDPLVQPWTKWVVGPGERGEPEGTISLGYGPLFPASTLDVRIFVTRIAPGPVAFDLHVLADNAILTLPDGEPAVFRVEIP